MEKIPFSFDTPVPKYFRDTGLFDNQNTFLFVTWAFSKCRLEAYDSYLDGQSITFEPFEFSAGRAKCAAECFLTEKQFRLQIEFLLKIGLLRKGANSKRNRYTTYVWEIERFISPDGNGEGPTKGQVRANPKEKTIKNPLKNEKRPTEKANQETSQLIDFQEEKHNGVEVMNNERPTEKADRANLGPTQKPVLEPSSEGKSPDCGQAEGQPSCAGARSIFSLTKSIHSILVEDISTESQSVNSHNPARGLTDFFSIDQCFEPSVSEKKTVQIYQNIFVTQEEYEKCLAIKGSREAVMYAVRKIMEDPKRKQEIKNWARTLLVWEIKCDVASRLVQNEQMARRIEEKHGEFDKSSWKAYIYTDRKKDQRGLLFESSSPYLEPVFIPLADPEFRQKVQKTLKDKKMQGARITQD